jgi:hypothetical protein
MTTIEEKIAHLPNVESCEKFAKNAEEHGRSDLAKLAHRRAVQLGANSHTAETDAERECLGAVYAYERTLKAKHGKAVRASYTWRMIKRVGIIPAVERAVNKPHDAAGYSALAEMGLEGVSFEAVVLRHPELFSDEAVQRSKERLEQWKNK